MAKAKEPEWDKSGLSSGIIPYIFINGKFYTVWGERKKTVCYSGKLSLPNGHIDIPVGGPTDKKNWQHVKVHGGKGFLIHDPRLTAIKEAGEEANLVIDESRIEPVYWDLVSFSISKGTYFSPNLYPYKITEDELAIMLKADTYEMCNWRLVSMRDLHLLQITKKIAIPLEYEAVRKFEEHLRLSSLEANNLLD